jgi:hypothetical protein
MEGAASRVFRNRLCRPRTWRIDAYPKHTRLRKARLAKRKFCVTDEAPLLLVSPALGSLPCPSSLRAFGRQRTKAPSSHSRCATFWCVQWLHAISIRWTSRTLMVLPGSAPGISRGGGIMANEQRFVGASQWLGPRASRRGVLQAGWRSARWRWGRVLRWAVPRCTRPHARTRRGELAGCGGHGPAARRARGPPLGERRALHQPAMRLRLSRHRRRAPLPPRLRKRAGPDSAHEARRDPENPAHQRPAAQPRYPARQSLASTPVQQHEPAFPRRTAARAASPTTSCA